MNQIQRKLLEKAKKSLEVAKQIHDSGYDEASQVIQQAEEMLSFAFDNLLDST